MRHFALIALCVAIFGCVSLCHGAAVALTPDVASQLLAVDAGVDNAEEQGVRKVRQFGFGPGFGGGYGPGFGGGYGGYRGGYGGYGGYRGGYGGYGGHRGGYGGGYGGYPGFGGGFYG